MFPLTRLGQRSARGVTLLAVGGLLLAGCGGGDGGDGGDEQAQNGQTQDEQTADDGSGGGAGGSGDLPDPSENIEDGVYRGSGVVLPVPDGWSVDPAGIQQGIVAATSDDGNQQLTARAISAGASATPGGSEVLDTLVNNVRQQVDQEPAADESVELAGAEQAHRLTFRDLPAQQDGQPNSSQTVLVASDGSALGQFTYSAPADAYDQEVAARLVDEAGFDPDSEPPAPQQPQSGAGQGGTGSGATGGQGG